jgi:ABC-type transporter Mla subunit MlaD
MDILDIKPAADSIANAVTDFGTKLEASITNLNTVADTLGNNLIKVTNNFFKQLNEVIPRININIQIKDKEIVE